MNSHRQFESRPHRKWEEEDTESARRYQNCQEMEWEHQEGTKGRGRTYDGLGEALGNTGRGTAEGSEPRR